MDPGITAGAVWHIAAGEPAVLSVGCVRIIQADLQALYQAILIPHRNQKPVGAGYRPVTVVGAKPGQAAQLMSVGAKQVGQKPAAPLRFGHTAVSVLPDTFFGQPAFQQVFSVLKREYFFPGPSGNIISASSIPFNFRKIWLAAGLKRDGEIKPRPYDFRHHFACANIARWAKEKKDVISMLPYLMRYMGHSSLEKTYYYVHLIPDYFADYAAATENLESLLPEVEPYEI